LPADAGGESYARLYAEHVSAKAQIQMTKAPRTLVAIAKGGSVPAIFAISLFLPFIEKREKV